MFFFVFLSAGDAKNGALGGYAIRPFQSGDETNVKQLLREAAFSNVWPGIISTARDRTVTVWVLVVALLVFAVAQSVLCCLSFVVAAFLVICLLHATVAVYYVYGPPLADLNRIAEVYQSRADTQFWVAVLQRSDGASEVAGTVAIGYRPELQVAGVAYLRRMAVSKRCRHRGIASSLLREAVDFCRLNDYRRVELITTDAHVAAMQLYRKFGFRCSNYRPRRYLRGLVSIWTYEFEYQLRP